MKNGNIQFYLNSIIAIFYPSGRPISLYLLRYEPFAVREYSLMARALQLQPSRPVNALGNPGSFVKKEKGRFDFNLMVAVLNASGTIKSPLFAAPSIFC